ncbi:MAG: UbiA family prenyltransferase [Acidobacteria bacterium]|nr:UbiA family prenyltransferase [Acidobacteriota bacterium]
MVKLQHTVFALPFAIISLVTATGRGWPPARVWLWVGLAMVGARTAAMAFNRLVDQRIDASNPRTAGRALPAGRLSRRFAWVVTIAASALFLLAAAELNRLCAVLAPVVLLVLFAYSLSKRVTAASHLWLGLGLGIAPVGAWIAATGRFAAPPFVLGAAVMLWVAGFDVIYSLQDETFDREHGLHSLPARLGGARALGVARAFHILALGGFGVFAAMAGGGALRYGAVILAGALLAWQHHLVRPGDLSRVDAAFFTANGMLSIVMCILFLFAKIPL